jgi:two-component system, NtrC family, sensor kinase
MTQILSVRLFVFIFVIMSLCFGYYAYQMIQQNSQQLLDTVYLSADRVSDLIKRSTRYSMMTNQNDDVHNIISALGAQPGVDAIQIYNKQGDIVYSTDVDVIGTSVDVSADACSICHSTKSPLEHVTMKNRMRLTVAEDGHRVLGLSNPIENEAECSNAACHAHSNDGTFLGVLDVKMSLAAIDANLESNRLRMSYFAASMIVGVALMSGLFLFVFVDRRVRTLIQGTNEIAGGNLGFRIKHENKDEIGQLAHSFNTMAMNLQEALDKLRQSSDVLEEKVLLKQTELEKAHEHMMRMEKLASLGKLSATVAHEINNPLAGVLNYTALILRILENPEIPPEKQQALVEYLGIIKSEISRCGDIVKNMLIFARQAGGTFAHEHLHPLLESSIMLVQHHLELKNIQIEKRLECENDVIVCDAAQIRQALIVLYVNAIEAMENGGKLKIHARCIKEKKMVRISVEDNGSGISKDVLPNIFDPFFSTKKESKGVGLGLAVVYGIVQRHNGDISVESKVNQGTTFCMDLSRELPIEISAAKTNALNPGRESNES